MNRSKETVYPPAEVLNPTEGKIDYDYVILWILNNNDFCGWADFVEEISESTLSSHLRKLRKKKLIEKPERNKYQITPYGKERFNELLNSKKLGKRRLKYPPKAILNRRNYDHWILWMLYNNYSCKWSDFKQNPLSINQTALSNNINLLLEKGYIIKENRQYIITPTGKSHFFTILKKYDLDRQSILEQQSKRIEEITEKTSKFFQKYKIKDKELKYRYISYLLTLNYSKIKNTLRDEEVFNIILLFLAINHPDQYPDYISPKDFSLKYQIDITTLNYYIKEIVDNELYQIKFFKLEAEDGMIFFFQKDEPLEKMLKVIVEKYTTKMTYLSKFQKNPSINIDLLLDNILNEISDNLFDIKLENSLKRFLPEYIRYLAYKIETEKFLSNNGEKLKNFIWQNIFEEFQTFISPTTFSTSGDFEGDYYLIDKRIFDILQFFYISKLVFLKTEEIQETYHIKKNREFEEIRNLLYENDIFKAKSLYEEIKEEISYLQKLILQDAIVTSEYNFNESIKICTEIIKKYPEEFIGYLFLSVTYFLMDDYEKSMEIVEKYLNKSPHPLLLCQKAQIYIKNHRGEVILDEINNAIIKYPDNLALKRIKIMLYTTHWDYLAKNHEFPVGIIDSALNLSPGDKELLLMKAIFLLLINKYREAKKFLIKEININIFKKNPRIDIAVLFILIFSYSARGKFHKALKTISQLTEMYPNHSISYLAKALVLGYNLIYKFNPDELNLESFFRLVNEAITHEQFKFNKVKYLILKAIVLYSTNQFDAVIETINSAIDIIPNLYYTHHVKIFYLIITNRISEVLKLIEQLLKKFPDLKYRLYNQKSSALLRVKRYQEALDVINDLLNLYPEDIDLINNKAFILGFLERKEEAIATAEKLIQLNPKIGNSYDTFGDIYMIFGEYEKAIEKFKDALRIEPVSDYKFQTFLRVGSCYKELNNYEKAREYYEKGKKLTERMIPSIREFYLQEAKKELTELELTLKNKKNENNIN